MRPDDVGLGGFDSHTLPPPRAGARAWVRPALALVGAASLALSPLRAQQRDTVGFKASARDTVPPSAQSTVAGALRPPVSPGRAFTYSLLLPGLGQAALDRRYVGAAFFAVEALSIALLHRSAEDLRIARAFVGDSVPLRYATDPVTGAVQTTNGTPIVAAWQPTRYTSALISARKLHYEDWVAIVIFNHLFSGADAFVAAQLWDLPAHVSLRAGPSPLGGVGVLASLRFR